MQIDLPGYKIKSTLGKGGMATVYLAIQESFEREVALKVMSPDLLSDPSFGERFIREAKIVSRLVHPNIVSVYDVGIHNGYYFLSMEYIPGKDLTHKYPELSLLERLRVVKEIARALDFAGKKGYVHRDVKPENIMLHEEDGRAVLMDFGIARPSDTASGVTQVGTAIGTPHYMSPEQARGVAVDSRADLYSLGVVLFLLITGRVPYDGDSAVVVGIMHISEDIPCLPSYLEAFQPIIDKIMAKTPAGRYQTGADFIAAVEAIPTDVLARIAESSKSQDVEHEWPVKPVKSVVRKPRVNAAELALGGSMIARSEDRIVHHNKRSPKTTSSNGAWLLVSLVVVLAAGYYFQEDVKKRWLLLTAFPKVHEASESIVSLSAKSPESDVLPAPPSAVASRSSLLSQADSLRESLKRDWKVAPQLAEIFRTAAKSSHADDQQIAQKGLEDLQDFYAALVRKAVQENTLESAEEYADSAKRVFGDGEKLSVLQDAFAVLNAAHLAVEASRQAAFQEQEKQSQHQLQQQLQLQQQQKETTDLRLKQEKQKAFEQDQLAKAKGQQLAGKLLAPAGDNALKTFRDLVAQNAQFGAAREGIAAIESTLVSQIKQMIEDEKYDDASEQLLNARENFPQSKVLLGLSVELERAMSDNMPGVSRLSVTGDEVDQLSEQQAPSIAAERIIYIGFEYRNFKDDASVLQAILYDGSRSLQIAQVPVVINGPSGRKFFRIEQPVAGFADGGYNIELLFKQEPLISAKFSVKK